MTDIQAAHSNIKSALLTDGLCSGFFLNILRIMLFLQTYSMLDNKNKDLISQVNKQVKRLKDVGEKKLD